MQFEVVTTDKPGHATVLASQLCNDYPVVVAAGGDGTISEVVNGLPVDSKAALGILPLGTGNDLARHLGIDKLAIAVATLASESAKPLDAIDVSLSGGRRSLAINVCGCGFDALVADRINQGFRAWRGTSAYVAAVISSLVKFKGALLQIVADEEEIEIEAMLCSIANSSSYGGGMKIAPRASVHDGLLDLVAIRSTSKLRFLTQFPKVFNGAHLELEEVLSRRVSFVRITSTPAMPVLKDGEILGDSPVEFRVLPDRIRVLRS